jgi:type IV pilus assembly protein PilE
MHGVIARSVPRTPQGGMTLVELLIVIAVIAVLGAIAVPSYQVYVMKARRADARSALTTAAQKLERYATENPIAGYSTATLGTGAGDVYSNKSENLHYNLSFAAPPTVSAYTLRAVPATGGTQVNDPCGTFTLTQAGVRDVSGGTKTALECWQ